MGRDHQFEIQYLISLTIAVLGIISANEVKQAIDIWIGYLFLFVVSVHFVVFNIYYTFGEAIDIRLDSVDWLRKESRWIWGLITTGFLFFLLHSVMATGFANVFGCGYSEEEIKLFLVGNITCGMGKILIAYGLPILVVGLMGVPFRSRIWSPLRALRNLNVKIAPSKIRVFSKSDETEPLFIKIENEGSNSYTYTLSVYLPENVESEYKGENFEDEFVREFTVNSGNQNRYNFPLRYSGSEMQSGLIEVEVEHDAGTVEKDVEVLLVPQ